MKKKIVPNLVFGVAMSLITLEIGWLISTISSALSAAPALIASAIMLGFALATHKTTERMGIDPILIGEAAVIPAVLMLMMSVLLLVAVFSSEESSLSVTALFFLAPILAAAILSVLLSILIRKSWGNRVFTIAFTAVLAWLASVGLLWLSSLIGIPT